MRNRRHAIRRHDFFDLLDSRGSRDLVVIGVPWDETSSYRRGATAGPDAIRSATSGRLYNQFTEQGLDLSAYWKVCDHGNVRATSVPGLKRLIASKLRLHDHQKPSILFLGGDHFITYPAFTTTAETKECSLSLLYFDAHPDLYPEYDGNRFSHATVVSRILEDRGHSSGSVCYVGIRASTKEQDVRIKDLGLSAYTARDIEVRGCETIASRIVSDIGSGPVYLSVDLDCLDPAFAPGVGNPQPGGLSTRQTIEILRGLQGLNVVAADIVEYSPGCESDSKSTGFTSAILIKELMGLMAHSSNA